MKYKAIENGFLVRCDIGDEVVAALTKFATEHDISSGTVSGIGALKNVVLGYFNLSGREYLKKEFHGVYELVSLSGNFGKIGADHILHCHAAISDMECKVFGGHLFEGTVAVTGEFYVMPGNSDVNRIPDKSTGLNLIQM